MTRLRLSGGSIGRKQAGATFALILLGAAGSYLASSKQQRDSLLGAKELGAMAVTRLFADSCAAAVVFEDDVAVKVALATLGRNDDVEYAAVWSVAKDGHAARRLGELSRGRTVPLSGVSLAAPIQREADRVNLIAAVRDQEGATVALAVTSFSLKHELRSLAAARRTVLIGSGLVGLAVTLLLMAMARVIIVRPLGKLVAADKALEKGGTANVQIRSNDEVGELARAFGTMATAIKVREGQINTRNRDMRLVLDNVGQGFLTLDVAGTMSDERSRVIDEWFGRGEGSPKFWEYLRRIDVPLGDWFEVGWMAVCDDVLPLTLCLDQLPSRIVKGDRTYELVYRPIMEAGRLAKTIVVITDVTVSIERQLTEQAQREMISMFRHMRSDRMALEAFLVEATGLVEAIVTAGQGTSTAAACDLTRLRRQVHTLKGNCALFGIESIAAYCHHLEQGMNEANQAISASEGERLHGLWAKVIATRAQLMDGGPAGGRIEIEWDEYASFLTDLRNIAEANGLLGRALSWQHEPAAQRLVLIADQIVALAARLGRSKVTVIREATSLRLPLEKWAPFWSAFAHVVRNAVDHGVEAADERTRCGKAAHATMTISVVHEAPHVIVTMADDGPGIAWDRIALVAEQRGLPHASRADLEQALFADAISSRTDSVSLTSGRGVGLGVVREVVSQLGGRTQIETDANVGTTFRFWLPETLLSQDEGAAVAGGERSTPIPDPSPLPHRERRASVESMKLDS